MSKSHHPFQRLIALLIFAVAVTYPAYAKPLDETRARAIYLYNFAKFASWPDVANASTNINICVLGTSDFYDAATLASKLSSNEDININAKKVSSVPSAPGECRILYISKSKTSGLSATLQKAAASHALTVSDIGGFTEKGGIIEFVKRNDKLGIHINKLAADKMQIKLDAQLLEVAKEVIR